MPRVTIKSLEQKIEDLKFISEYQSNEINKLNTEIDTLKDSKNVVSVEEYNFLLKQLEVQKQSTAEYKKLYEDLKEKYSKKCYIDSSEIKLNARNAGRKMYSNKEVIEKIYKFYVEGKSLREIANELNSTGIKTNRNKDWSKSSIRFILLNSKNVTNEFIDKSMFERTVKLLNDKKRPKLE